MKLRKDHIFMTAYFAALLGLATMGYGVGDYTIRAHQKSQAAKNNNFTTDVAFLTLPRMNFSILSQDGRPGRLRIDMTLEVEQKNIARLEDYQPRITDRLSTYVRRMDMDDIRRPNAAVSLRKQLLKEVNNASYPVPVMDIIFRQFVIM
ncbi:MAG: flagellar basal body-associated FliL family protein [Alphaproteobacteria bacterium]